MGFGKLLIVGIVIGGLSSIFLASILFDEVDTKGVKLRKIWWGPSNEKNHAKEDIRPFKIQVSEDELQDLKNRLGKARLSKSLEGVQFKYGTNQNYLKSFLEYWKDKYDWRKQEKFLNSLPQFMVKISGIDIHFVHVKPKNPEKKKVVPILLAHGWPGSVVEFYNVMKKLVEDKKDKSFVFEVICPHIPGYGFSEAPTKPGFSPSDAAVIYVKLMEKLGHNKYLLQGGDWGSVITTIIAQFYPERVLGLHLNMAPYDSSPLNLLKWVVGSFVPSVAPAAQYEIRSMYPIKSFLSRTVASSGYFHLQATVPDSLGAGMVDSPTGLASYMLYIFAFATNLKEAADLPNGGLDTLNKDELINNIMVYWLSKSMVSSMRFYKEAMSDDFRKLKTDRIKVNVPTSFLFCDREPLLAITALGINRYKNVTQWHKSSECGHFAAMENPQLMTDEIWRFAESLKL